MELRLSVQKFGEGDPVTLGIKGQLQEIEERSGAARLESPTASEFLQFQAGFRARRGGRDIAVQAESASEARRTVMDMFPRAVVTGVHPIK